MMMITTSKIYHQAFMVVHGNNDIKDFSPDRYDDCNDNIKDLSPGFYDDDNNVKDLSPGFYGGKNDIKDF